ncbi:hypothetical protein [Helicobacter ailurogastricus]|uniref:hypothetical protein n=1 Tax=Helicobacter ailurogastricus TaxID=1578720 RepID=UPI0006B43B27|nr:hypothetical protein [Helicobacter ailurogastricus]
MTSGVLAQLFKKCKKMQDTRPSKESSSLKSYTTKKATLRKSCAFSPPKYTNNKVGDQYLQTNAKEWWAGGP